MSLRPAGYQMKIVNINLIQKLAWLFEKTNNVRRRGRGWPKLKKNKFIGWSVDRHLIYYSTEIQIEWPDAELKSSPNFSKSCPKVITVVVLFTLDQKFIMV